MIKLINKWKLHAYLEFQPWKQHNFSRAQPLDRSHLQIRKFVGNVIKRRRDPYKYGFFLNKMAYPFIKCMHISIFYHFVQRFTKIGNFLPQNLPKPEHSCLKEHKANLLLNQEAIISKKQHNMHCMQVHKVIKTMHQ